MKERLRQRQSSIEIETSSHETDKISNFTWNASSESAQSAHVRILKINKKWATEEETRMWCEISRDKSELENFPWNPMIVVQFVQKFDIAAICVFKTRFFMQARILAGLSRVRVHETLLIGHAIELKHCIIAISLPRWTCSARFHARALKWIMNFWENPRCAVLPLMLCLFFFCTNFFPRLFARKIICFCSFYSAKRLNALVIQIRSSLINSFI